MEEDDSFLMMRSYDTVAEFMKQCGDIFSVLEKLVALNQKFKSSV